MLADAGEHVVGEVLHLQLVAHAPRVHLLQHQQRAEVVALRLDELCVKISVDLYMDVTGETESLLFLKITD